MATRAARNFLEFNFLDPDPRDEIPEVEEDAEAAEEIARKLQHDCKQMRHIPRLSDEYIDD